MANRTVSVGLELLAAQYQAEADKVIAKTLGMDRAVEDLDRDINKLGPDAAKAAAEMALLGQEHGKLGAQAEHAANNVDDIGDAIKKADQEIARSKTLLQELAAEFGRTGDLDVVKKISGEQGNLGRLQRLRTDLDNIKTDAEKASKEMEKLLAGAGNTGHALLDFALDEWVGKLAQKTKQGLSSGLDSISSWSPNGIVQWLVAGGVAGAPALLAVIDGALLAGVGTIGIGAAIAAQARDPQIGAAYKSLGGAIMQDLTEATSGFKQPMLALAQDFRNDWTSVLPALKSGWDALAPSVERFGQGVAGLATHTIPGFVDAEKASVDIINMLGDELPRLGDSFSSFFSSVAGGAEGGKKALQDTLIILESMVVWLGKVIEYGSKAFNWLDKVPGMFGILGQVLDHTAASSDVSKKSLEQLNIEGNLAAHSIGNLTDSGRQAGLGMQLSAADFKTFAGAIAATRHDVDALAASMVDKIIGATLQLDQATNGFDKSLITLGDTLVANGGHLSEHVKALKKTETGAMQNKDAIYAVIQANLSVYDSMIKVGFSAEDAAAKYSENTRALEDQMRAAGYTQAQIDGLIGKYRDVPKNVDTTIAMHGLTEAIQGLDDTIRRVNGLDGRVATMTIQEIHRTITQNITDPTQVFHGLAAGGVRAYAFGGVDYAAASGILPPSSPGTILAAEPQTGGEVLTPLRGISPARAMSLSQVVGDAYGFDVMPRYRAATGSGGGAATTVRHEHTVVIQEPSGRRLAELVIEDSRNGGTAFNAYIRQVASR